MMSNETLSNILANSSNPIRSNINVRRCQVAVLDSMGIDLEIAPTQAIFDIAGSLGSDANASISNQVGSGVIQYALKCNVSIDGAEATVLWLPLYSAPMKP
jgi:hypothetical protein